MIGISVQPRRKQLAHSSVKGFKGREEVKTWEVGVTGSLVKGWGRGGGGVAEMGGDEFVPFPGYLFLRLFFHREMYSGERLELADPAASLPLFLLSKGCSCKKDISMAANGCRKR